MAHQLCAQLAGLARCGVDEHALGQAQCQLGGLALPNGHGGYRLIGRKQAHHIGGGVAPIEEFLGLGGTGVVAASAQHHGQQAALAFGALTQRRKVPPRRGHHAKPGSPGVAGFEAVHRGVAEQQNIAVAFVGSRRAWVTPTLNGVKARILRKVLQQTVRQSGQVGCRAGVPRRGKALGVNKAGLTQAQGLGLAVHALDKRVDRACHPFGQGHSGVVARLHNHAFEQVFDGNALTLRGKHAGAGHGGGALADHHTVGELDAPGLQRVKHHIGRHEFGERGGLYRRLLVMSCEHVARGHVEQQIGLGRHFGRSRQGRTLGPDRAGCKAQAEAQTP